MDDLVDLIIIAFQFALTAVLAVAAIGKFLDLAGSRTAVNAFGVPKRWADPLGTALPALELLLALLLLPGATARWAALGSALLFLAFIAGVAFNLSRGRQPECHCFGQFHSEPAGWPTIVRNAGFFLIASVIVWKGSQGPVDWFSGLPEATQIIVVFGAALLALGGTQVWLSLQAYRQNARLLAHLETTGGTLLSAPVEATLRSAPVFDLPAMDGGRLTSQGLLASGKSVLLLFVDPGCGPCRDLVPDVHEWHRRFSSEITVALISRGTPEENREKFGQVAVGIQDDRKVSDAYGIEGTPSGVFIHPDGTIHEPPAPGQANIRNLVVRMMRDLEQSGSARAASPAPDLDGEFDPLSLLHVPEGPDLGTHGTRLPLPDLDGGYVGIDDLRGQPTILLFWDPDSAFCQRMLPEVKEWEAESGDAHLLVISIGSETANRELGLRSRIVIDDGFTTGQDYGVTGTPSAILLDAEGRVASPLVAGEDAVLDMLYEVSETSAEPSIAEA